jgi:hypothetical protein
MKIDYFLVKQIKKNLFYLITLVLIIFLFFFSINYFFNKKNLLQQKKETIINEITTLENKKNIILTAKNIQSQNLPFDELNKALNTLFPNDEDYFSIIFALEKISQKTGFQVIGYEINLKKSTDNKLAITISGIGDRNSFMNFIKNYRFIGNRLITIDNINFTEGGMNQTKIDLNFYRSGDEKLASYYQIKEKDKELLREILEKTDILVNEESSPVNYETKDNPF